MTPWQVPPMWSGETVAVLATGPRMSEEVAASVRHLPCIAVNDSYRVAPWADMLFAHDAQWWETNPAARDFAGLKVAGQDTPAADRYLPFGYERIDAGGRVVELRNSGMEAIRLAARAGARRIFALGFDPTPGHFHDEHKPPRKRPDPETYALWSTGLRALTRELAEQGVEVVASPGQLPRVHVHGMRGLGDAIHQRAVVRELARTREVWLRTRWPQVYADMPQVHTLPHEREAGGEPSDALPMSIGYHGGAVRTAGSVVQAMAASAGVSPGDFRLAVPDAWRTEIAALGLPADRPVAVYRPLVERAGCPWHQNRNPDAAAYLSIFQRLRARYFVVSVADLADVREWRVDEPVAVDLELNRGELGVEGLAALFERAALVYSAPGFATVLAQAVGTPSVTVFGGYEDARSFSWGARSTPWLAIQPARPCCCWRPGHDCDKGIDLEAASADLDAFVEGLACK